MVTSEQLDAALAHVRPALAPDATVDDMLAVARLWHRDGRFAESRALYERILAGAPEHPDALNFYGVLLFQIDIRPDAIAALRKCIELAPDYHDAHANLGLMLSKTGDFDGAERHLRRAIELDPEPVSPRVNLAILMRTQGKLAEALGMLDALQDEAPQDPLVRHALAGLLRLLGRPEEARAHLQAAYTSSDLALIRARMAYGLAVEGKLEEARDHIHSLLQVDPDSPELAHMLAAYGGAPIPGRTQDQVVSQMFDSFSKNFDSKLATLKYRAPELVADLLGRLPGLPTDIDLLDAGCGTGLLGKQVRTRVRRLDGVDLSAGMLDKARALGIYDELAHAELTAHLESLHDRYDVITCVDTLCYFGALDAVARAAHGSLRPGGWLIFSVEDGGEQEQGHELKVSGRYAHRRDYVEQVLREAGFAQRVIESGVLRSELKKPVAGLICAARRSA